MNSPVTASDISSASFSSIEDLHPDLLTQILLRLDGPSLAAAGFASSRLRALATNPDIWHHLCASSWPSLLLQPSLLCLAPPRSLFADSYPFPIPCPAADPHSTASPAQPALVSAVDLYHRGDPVFSRVLETETLTSWFLGSPFRVDALDRKDPPPAAFPTVCPNDLTLSWIVADPAGKRSVNISSRRAVSVSRHWYTGEIQVRFATVLCDDAAAIVVVTCRGGVENGEGAEVREVSMTVEDMDGKCLSGEESAGLIRRAMEGRRSRRLGREETAAGRYWEFEGRRRERKEKKMRREGRMDLFLVLAGVALFFGLIGAVALW